MKRYFGPIAAFVLFATPAAAQWEWTEWGMSPEAAIAVSGGRAEAYEPQAGEVYEELEGLYPNFTVVARSYPRARFDHKIGGVPMEGKLVFTEDNRLLTVLLTADRARCGEVLTALGEQYGAAEESGGPGFGEIYIWDRDGQKTTLLDSEAVDLCNVSIQAL